MKTPMTAPAMAAIGLLVTIGLGVGSVAHGAMLTNGSFEDPNIGADSYSNAPIGGTGWTAVGGEVRLVNNNGGGFGATLGPQQGSQWLYLAGGNGSTYVEQAVTGLTVGDSYQLNGFYGLPGRNANLGSFKVSLVGSGDIFPFTYATSATWTAFSAPFTAMAGSATIQIISMGGSGDMVGIDNLTLVPEPMTIGLVATGLLVLGGGRKRRLASTHS